MSAHAARKRLLRWQRPCSLTCPRSRENPDEKSCGFGSVVLARLKRTAARRDKTTTLRMILGLAASSSGRALMFDHPYAELPRAALRIGALLEAPDFHPGRSGRDHLRMLGQANIQAITTHSPALGCISRPTLLTRNQVSS